MGLVGLEPTISPAWTSSTCHDTAPEAFLLVYLSTKSSKKLTEKPSGPGAVFGFMLFTTLSISSLMKLIQVRTDFCHSYNSEEEGRLSAFRVILLSFQLIAHIFQDRICP